ncbi:MAG: response regulator [Elusimicrobiota bacterium]
MAIKTIAIIEDDRDYLQVLTDILEKEGFSVFGASNGFEIINDMVENKPDLIITDLKLPELDGDKVMAAFQDRDVIKGVPILVISSKDEEDIKTAAKKIDAVAYLKKPVDNNKLIELVHKYTA